jgi:hypothetical protein
MLGERSMDLPVWPISRHARTVLEVPAQASESIDLEPAAGYDGKSVELLVVDRKTTNKALTNEVLKAYPDKVAKRRAKHLGQFEEGKPDCGVKSNNNS